MILQEMRYRYAAICDQQAAIPKAALDAGRPMTKEETDRFNALQTEIDAMDATIKAAQAAEDRQAALAQPVNEPWRPSATAAVGAPVQPDKLDDGGFASVGELLHCLRFGDKRGRIQNLSTSEVGVMFPPAFSTTIMQLDGESEIVGPRATAIPAGDPPDAPFTIPYFQQGAEGALGGITLTWTAEWKQVQEVGTPGIKDLTLTPQEVAGLATVNNKTLENWAASGTFMQNLMRMALAMGRDWKHLFGSGVGCPLGIYKSPGAVKVLRDTAATIKYIDTLNMLAALYAGPGEPVYIANQTLMPTIMTLADGAGRYIFNAGDATRGIPPTLNGIRIIWNGKTPALGSEGDLVLAKLNYYLTKQGAGPFVAISDQFKFDTVQTVFRIVARMDGQLWVKEPLKLEGGALVSPVVILK